LRQFLLNLKKNLPQNYVEAVATKSWKESAPKLCGGSSHIISKRIHPKFSLFFITFRVFKVLISFTGP
jgi:hypothetical protein